MNRSTGASIRKLAENEMKSSGDTIHTSATNGQQHNRSAPSKLKKLKSMSSSSSFVTLDNDKSNLLLQ